MSADKKSSSVQVLKFALIICLACSVLVSVTAVSLRGLQEQNIDNEKKLNVLRAAGLVGAEQRLSSREISAEFAKVVPVVVNLETGELVKDKNPLTYNMYDAARSDEGRALTNDPASIKRIAKDGIVYALTEDERVTQLILPIQGYGLWSTMYGFTALSLNEQAPEITGLTFYQQAETAGLGARITEPAWQAKWQGLKPYSENGQPQVRILKRGASADNEVDGIVGATLTSKGVEALMNFWLGEQGYQPFIAKISAREISAQDLREASQMAIASTQEN